MEGEKHVENKQEQHVQEKKVVRRRSGTDVETRDDTEPDRRGPWWSCKQKERNVATKQRALRCVWHRNEKKKTRKSLPRRVLCSNVDRIP